MNHEHNIDIEESELLERLPLRGTVVTYTDQTNCLSRFFPLPPRAVANLQALSGLEAIVLFLLFSAQAIIYNLWQHRREDYENLACNGYSYLNPTDCAKLANTVAEYQGILKIECWIATVIVISLAINLLLLATNRLAERSRTDVSNQQSSQRLGASN